MTYPILTLLSDFGWQDVYVAVMKGVIASINRAIVVIDLTHLVPAQDVNTARFQLLSAVPYFPPNTVHVAVVDPGVGSHRRGVSIASDMGIFVGPDNGLFSGVLSTATVTAAVELSNPDYWRSPTPSHTFHGRDIFAPAGAHLVSGVPMSTLGSPIDPSTLVSRSITPCRASERGWIGGIQAFDHFGNTVTTIPASALSLANSPAKHWQIAVGSQTLPLVSTYSDVAVGQPLALIGSHGWLELAINQGNARQTLSLHYTDSITVEQIGDRPLQSK